MSSSPSICASPNFTFPSTNSPRDTPVDYFTMKADVKNSFPHPGPPSSRIIPSQHAQKPPSLHPSGPKAKLTTAHKSINDSISSITSNTSDLTIYENSFGKSLRTNSIASTDTLVDDTENESDKLNLPRRSNKSQSASSNDIIPSTGLLSCRESEEIESNKASSATESSFPFHTATPSSSQNYSHAIQAPPVKKQFTLPIISLQNELSLDSIKHEQLKRLHSLPTMNYRQQIENLSSTSIKYISEAEADLSLRSNSDPLLVIDIRPFADYVKSHLKTALNVCLPSTLLKRPNFNLHRCINSLPAYEKLQFKDLFATLNGKVFIYDYYENSANLYHMCNKFVNSPLFVDTKHSIYLIDANLSHFNEQYSHLFEEGSTSNINTSSAHENNPSGFAPQLLAIPKNRAQSLADLSAIHKSNHDLKRHSTSIDFDTVDSSTPILSNFSLPKLTGGNVFKIRHNEELYSMNSNPFDFSGSSSSSTLNQNASNLFKLQNLPKDKSHLPEWLKSSVLEGLVQSNKINADFFALEKFEQKRLISALSLKNSEGVLSPIKDEVVPTISCGIEYGHKNRYKDIFLFEHSRVKLGDLNGPTSTTDIPSDDDYINASYLDPISNLEDYSKVTPQVLSHLKFIATQGPLEQTMGDFWKCIITARSPIVMSLTDEIENGVMKCSPFWKSGVYRSNQDVINLKLTGEVRVSDHLILRSFSMTMSNVAGGPTFSHNVLQMHLLSWPDMGTISTPLDIIQLVQLKYYILEKMQIQEDCNYPTVIHCSAGCGRTGTFGAIDTVINILKNNNSQELNSDPIHQIVNNFRRQRISMVQNLRQYYLIYEIVLNYLNVGNSIEDPTNTLSHWDDLTKLDIVNDFIATYPKL
ncbi:uncharacterized protein CANTADRAFT_339250 [Suhomyces tanzawaensis NRRL Y-17324]|uniref:protein-tyrosine-phosphatase n=1 Tax=Suhomyces tanzawaensis NRRL Y-17324 TaxID=984487 RepID=A0A1E4SJ95_9ASCO|nr:uncharacterized protein CANTADRAFT_339250 [Suhomyces tanzawaensis NRRL Y-17324]ODV79585.1 hypothetical protein CANTADRAFT_339250 [Suhomyces tanzawaensis NRRL Y-17324]